MRARPEQSSIYVGNGVFMCCDAIDVCLERVFVASVYTENGWF